MDKKKFKTQFYEKLLDKNFCNSYGINIKKMEMTLNEHVSNKYDYKWPLFTLFTVYQYGTIQGHKMISKYKILFTIPNFDTAGSGKAL